MRSRPKCFELAMDFMGDPEESEIREYIEYLEKKTKSQAKEIEHLLNVIKDEKDGWK